MRTADLTTFMCRLSRNLGDPQPPSKLWACNWPVLGLLHLSQMIIELMSSSTTANNTSARLLEELHYRKTLLCHLITTEIKNVTTMT